MKNVNVFVLLIALCSANLLVPQTSRGSSQATSTKGAPSLYWHEMGKAKFDTAKNQLKSLDNDFKADIAGLLSTQATPDFDDIYQQISAKWDGYIKQYPQFKTKLLKWKKMIEEQATAHLSGIPALPTEQELRSKFNKAFQKSQSMPATE